LPPIFYNKKNWGLFTPIFYESTFSTIYEAPFSVSIPDPAVVVITQAEYIAGPPGPKGNKGVQATVPAIAPPSAPTKPTIIEIDLLTSFFHFSGSL